MADGRNNGRCRTAAFCTDITVPRRTIGIRHCLNGGRTFIAFVLFLSSLSVASSELVMRDFDSGVTEPMWITNEFNLDRNGSNVCIKISLRPLTDFWGPADILNECERIYRRATCNALRSRSLRLSDLYIRRGNIACCDGFQRSGRSTNCPVVVSSQSCSLDGLCLNNGTCNPITGVCTCARGFTGDHCQYTCPDDRYGEGCAQTCNCANGGSCHPKTGTCLCGIGFVGSTCEIECSSIGGATEDPRCSSFSFCDFCSNSTCDHVLSACWCADGWRGRFCTHTCRNFTHGSLCNTPCQCRGSSSSWCNAATGRCICRPGWTGRTCDQRCPIGSYGFRCQRACDCPVDGCDPTDGRCTCPRGWHGQSCTHPCNKDQWGMNCSQQCDCDDSEECDPISGQCYKLVTNNGGDESDGIDIGLITTIAGSGAVLLAAAAILVITLSTKRKREQDNASSNVLDDALQANGSQANATLGNGTVRYHHHLPSQSSAPVPLPRDPSTFSNLEHNPVHDDNSYLELDINGGSAQVDNPVYAYSLDHVYETPS